MDLFGTNKTTKNTENQFYDQLFRTFDVQNFGTIQGGIVFKFFLSSGLTKAALGDIWDEATQKHSGGLSLAKFINAMKLIALAQRGIAPKLANIAQNPLIPLPQMQYPAHLKKPTENTSGENENIDAVIEADPFGALGALPKDSISANNINVVAKPKGPIWNNMSDAIDENDKDDHNGIEPILNLNTNAANVNMNNISAANTAAAAAVVNNNNVAIVPAVGITKTNANEYAPPTHIKQHASTLTLTVVDDATDHDLISPGLNRRISHKILYQEERLREQIRQAEQREKLAKKQANTQRIENERLERENEQLKYEINGARQMQSDALKQSQEALNSIQPLRVENEKLKQAINQWKELIQTKDEELEALEAEVDSLRLENEKLENILRDDKSKVDDIQFKLERADALLKEFNSKNKDYETQISQLVKDNISLEDDKRNLDLKVAQIKDEMKKLKRNQNSGLGLDKNSLKQKEADLFNIGNISFNISSSSAAAAAAAPQQKQIDDDNIVAADIVDAAVVDIVDADIVPVGNHDFNFMEEDTINISSDNDNDDADDEPEFIDKVITEEIEIEQDVIKTVLFDDDYRSSDWFMSKDEMKSYHKYFIQADLNKDGVIDGAEANKFFTKSKLNRKLLAKIWVLADQKKQAKLSEQMFCVMFHIVMKVKKSGNKLSVPNDLPACLAVDVVEKLGTKIQKTVKEKKLVTQKKTIKVENPNKNKKNKKKKTKKKEKKKAKKEDKSNDVLNFDNNNNNDWNNDFSFDTTQEDDTTNKNVNNNDAAAATVAVTTTAAEITTENHDDNWNDFGNFFDQ